MPKPQSPSLLGSGIFTGIGPIGTDPCGMLYSIHPWVQHRAKHQKFAILTSIDSQTFPCSVPGDRG